MNASYLIASCNNAEANESYQSHVFYTQVALATEIPDYNQMTLPLGGGHSATAAQMRHFCRSYEFQLPPQPSPPLPPPSTVQFSTLGPGGRHVYCNIPMTLLNGQVGEKTKPRIRMIFLVSPQHPTSAQCILF